MLLCQLLLQQLWGPTPHACMLLALLRTSTIAALQDCACAPCMPACLLSLLLALPDSLLTLCPLVRPPPASLAGESSAAGAAAC